jgi:hypothetical protein
MVIYYLVSGPLLIRAACTRHMSAFCDDVLVRAKALQGYKHSPVLPFESSLQVGQKPGSFSGIHQVRRHIPVSYGKTRTDVCVVKHSPSSVPHVSIHCPCDEMNILL